MNRLFERGEQIFEELAVGLVQEIPEYLEVAYVARLREHVPVHGVGTAELGDAMQRLLAFTYQRVSGQSSEKATLIQCLSGSAIGSSPSTVPMLPDSLADTIGCEKGGQPARPLSFGRKGLKRKDSFLRLSALLGNVAFA